jgi:iron complex outermembrane receptor protein
MVFVGLSYNTDLAGGNLLINANYSYRGDDPAVRGAGAGYRPGGLRPAGTPASSGPVATSTWLVGLHGKNLTDEEYRTAGYCFGFSGCPSALGLENNTTVFFGPPTTGFVTVEYRFQ